MERLRQQWDPEFSTYFWKIHLNAAHEYNSTPVLTGYSKVRNQSEAQDKDALLRKKICMLYFNGYFMRMTRIEFFFRYDPIVKKNDAEKILVCFTKTYDIPEPNYDVIYKKHDVWLKAFYERINSGRTIEDILPAVRRGNIDKDKFLDVDSYNFATPGHLHAHAARLYAHGHAPGAIEHFITQYKNLRKW